MSTSREPQLFARERWIVVAAAPALVVALHGCSSPPRHKTAPRCPSTIYDELRAAGVEARTIEVVVVYSKETCLRGDERHVSLIIDDGEKSSVSLPCYRAPMTLAELEIRASAPTYDGGRHVVDEGWHTLVAIDEDTGQKDVERFAVPHVEIAEREFFVGNVLELSVSASAIHIHGPVAFRMPGL
jgi:hypothetical protein